MQPSNPSGMDPEPPLPPRATVRNAIILAAGRGVRLQERGRLSPKGCMRL